MASWMAGRRSHLETLLLVHQATRVWRAGLFLLSFCVGMASVRVATAGINAWTSIGPEGGAVNALAIDPVTPTTLYAGTYYGGVFKSTDGGDSWGNVTGGDVQTLAIDPATPTTLYAGMAYYGVSKSIDAGENWVSVNVGLSSTYVRALVVDPTMPTTFAVQSGLSTEMRDR
jgi:hypothetical protein